MQPGRNRGEETELTEEEEMANPYEFSGASGVAPAHQSRSFSYQRVVLCMHLVGLALTWGFVIIENSPPAEPPLILYTIVYYGLIFAVSCVFACPLAMIVLTCISSGPIRLRLSFLLFSSGISVVQIVIFRFGA